MAGYRFGKQAQFGTGNYMSNDDNNMGMVVGSSNTLSGSRNMIVGNNNISIDGGADNIIIGHSNHASGSSSDSILAGRFHQSNMVAAAAFGDGCDVVYPASINLGNYLSSKGQGSAQHTTVVIKASTTTSAVTELKARGDTRLTIKDGEAWTFRADVVCKQTAGGAGMAFYIVEGVLNRTGATTSMPAGATISNHHESDSGNMELTCTADDTNDSLNISWTSGVTANYEMVATVYITKVEVSTS
jgi:hypothetical protein